MFEDVVEGVRFAGSWADDMPNGAGELVYRDGGKYEGDIVDGKRHGLGKRAWYRPAAAATAAHTADERVYIGQWDAGYRDGLGVEETKQNGKYLGEWSKNKKNGLGILQ